jgi:hypothetical protein
MAVIRAILEQKEFPSKGGEPGPVNPPNPSKERNPLEPIFANRQQFLTSEAFRI